MMRYALLVAFLSLPSVAVALTSVFTSDEVKRCARFRLPQLGQAGEQSLIIEVCPADILHVGNFHAIRLPFDGQGDHLGNAFNIVPMDDDVQSHWKSDLFRRSKR